MLSSIFEPRHLPLGRLIGEALWQAEIPTDLTEVILGNISAPTLLVTVERTALRESYYPRWINSVPKLRQLTLPGGRHLHMENPEPVADATRAFLATR